VAGCYFLTPAGAVIAHCSILGLPLLPFAQNIKKRLHRKGIYSDPTAIFVTPFAFKEISPSQNPAICNN
jgi:hypothetical protein